VFGFTLLGLDMPFALPCLARFCRSSSREVSGLTPGVVGGGVILPSMLPLVKYNIFIII
jgi:hypothetical protein